MTLFLLGMCCGALLLFVVVGITLALFSIGEAIEPDEDIWP